MGKEAHPLARPAMQDSDGHGSLSGEDRIETGCHTPRPEGRISRSIPARVREKGVGTVIPGRSLSPCSRDAFHRHMGDDELKRKTRGQGLATQDPAGGILVPHTMTSPPHGARVWPV